MDIIGIGDTDVDLMIQVDHVPAHDEKVRGTLVGKFAGGVIGNFCSAAAALGAKTGVVAKVGCDEYGDICLRDFKSRGIDTAGMVVDALAETYFSIVHLDETGEKALTIVQTSGFLPNREELDMDYVRKARYVHMTTLDVALADHVFEQLKGDACVRSLDIEPTASDADREIWKRLLRNVDIAFPNEAGLAALTQATDIRTGAEALLDAGVKTVVVTCGASGVRIFEKGYYHEQPVFSVEVKDSTGAGDCFNAAFITSLLNNRTLAQSAKYASAAAAISIGFVGAREGLPSHEQVMRFLHDRGETI